jgi:predicted amidohydrolase YtcJ
MRAAVNRRSRSGSAIGPAEALSPEQALALFTSAADDAGGAVRRVEEGCVADLCLLNQPWKDARLRLRSDDVIASFRNGKCIFHRDGTEKQGTRDASAAA